MRTVKNMLTRDSLSWLPVFIMAAYLKLVNLKILLSNVLVSYKETSLVTS